MIVIVMTGWKVGLRKVSLSLLQRDLLGLPLSVAKRNVDKVLDREEVRIEVADLGVARAFVEEARRLGTECSLEEE